MAIVVTDEKCNGARFDPSVAHAHTMTSRCRRSRWIRLVLQCLIEIVIQGRENIRYGVNAMMVGAVFET